MSFRVLLQALCALVFVSFMSVATAQGNLEINTPAISALQKAMQQRHNELAPLYDAGAVGLARDGNVALRDASSVPLAQRSRVNTLIASENADRASLYREIARANGHPEWETDIRATFAQRWIDRAQCGWWVEGAQGWTRK